ncbi:hypothetical protein FPSE_06109 [Fusarium pseudograminearum CS3096]|uniref:Uncharacterized protein n=1 Tax=Fusarium pseudograminearum (strain CS3096) TaxID=1028729 RepID=K3W086_FUSPC|nr:hypothetical protein FPSE_06109 [Fusarium pseudograminearum CS3096]EKJ73715.1 hypothetical protein FPSE_06109 [Fusarium pseudograminearum CS3096]
MTSNIRFNAMVDTITRDGKATGPVLGMVPRSRRGYVPVTSCDELSFVLSGVLMRIIASKGLGSQQLIQDQSFLCLEMDQCWIDYRESNRHQHIS